MTTTTAALVPIQPAFTDAERLALAGFLAGYRGLTREAYALDLRQFTTWCRVRSLSLFAVLAWITSLTLSPWTATSSAPCWSPPVSARRPSTP